jgi:hypothetical protein
MYKNFKGTVDELLEHCSSVDVNELEQVVCNGKDIVLTPEEARDALMEDFHLSKEDAEKYVLQIQLEEFNRIASGMVENGLLEITKYDSEGNPEYKVTDKGEQSI